MADMDDEMALWVRYETSLKQARHAVFSRCKESQLEMGKWGLGRSLGSLDSMGYFYAIMQLSLNFLGSLQQTGACHSPGNVALM